jgi:hypothetical protein
MNIKEQNSIQAQLSETKINWIREQGYFKFSNAEIRELAFGNRFAYGVCTSLLIVGVAFANIPLLFIMMVVAFLGIVLPNHPFDYFYNLVLRTKLNKPKLPPRPKQLKFACTIATLWIGGTIYLFYSGLATWGYIAGASLIVVAGLVSTIDMCIPSKIYNALFIKNLKALKSNA